jgi:hypothetical protein
VTVEPRPGLHEVVAVWWVGAIMTLAVATTYARLPAEELYNTQEEGVAGGLGRALVFLNFPWALVAVALALVCADRLDERWSDAAAALAVALAVVTVVPGVVEQGDLDARAVNAIPAAGVGLALALTGVALSRGGLGHRLARTRGDDARIAVARVLALAAIPWWFAEWGFYVSDVPLLGSLFLAEEVVPEPGHPHIRAVHLGHHHGTAGVLFALAALALSRQLPSIRRAALRRALAVYLSLMLVYGFANAVQDFWLEQVVKRGTTDAAIPSFLRPSLDLGSTLLVLAAVAVYALLFRQRPPVRRP